MPIPECPVCHKRASLEGRQLYCPNCGWNRDAAIAAIRASIKMLPAGIVMFCLFFLFMFYVWHFRNPAQLAILGGGPAFAILFTYFYSKRRLAKLAALQANRAQPSADAETSVRSAPGDLPATGAIEPDPHYQVLLSTSRPRRIRLAQRGQFNVAIGLIVVLIFATTLGVHLYGVWARTLSFATFGPKDWFIVGLSALILLIPYGMWRSQVRECDLLENGEIAMARITRQWFDKSNSSIEYEFKDFLGQSHRGLGYDYTKKLYQDMAVPVFYDTNNPKRQVAYCSALHEVAV